MGVKMESGLVVTTFTVPACNLTGGGIGTICKAPSFKTQQQKKLRLPSPTFAHLHNAPFMTGHKTWREVIAKEGKPVCSAEYVGGGEQVIVYGSGCQLSAFNKKVLQITKIGGVCR